jgi:hypothetical protein
MTGILNLSGKIFGHFIRGTPEQLTSLTFRSFISKEIRRLLAVAGSVAIAQAMTVFTCSDAVAQNADNGQSATQRQTGGSAATGDQTTPRGNFHEGTDFKIGPVTDDSKLLKPFAGEHNHTADNNPDREHESKESASADRAGMTDNRRTNKEIQFGAHGKISVGALQVAEDLEILPQIKELIEWREAHGNERDARNLTSLAMRQELHEDLFSAFLQTRRVISELDRQISGYEAVARVLEDKRDQAIRTNNILNFTTNGALTMSAGAISVGTPTNFQNAGNELSVVAGGLTALIGAYALKIEKGGRRSADLEPNMLASIFDLAPVDPNKYPPVIWNYMNAYEPGQKITRREQIIHRWKTLHYIDTSNEARAIAHLRELSSTVALKNKVTIQLLRTRIPMLEDLRSTVAGMNEYLDEILSFIRGPERVAIKYHAVKKISLYADEPTGTTKKKAKH